MNKKNYDVAICGAGLAGLTLARQLKQKMPDLSIAVLDRLKRPLPEATHKVGESTVSVGTYYVADVLGLQDYLDRYHLPKLGVRFFLGKTKVPFHKRSEFGQSEFFQCSFPYQIDRGRFENDLRQFNVEAGIEIRENCFLKKIELSQSSEIPHKITYSQGSQQTSSLQARWVIDAMGRRRFLQKQLNLAKPNNPKYSAAWFRIEDRIDISDFVPNEQRQWHDRVPNRNRYYSTNNLCGEGYWVWLIPLPSGYTSIGIVTDEEIHPFEEYHTYERAYQWLEKYESILAAHLQGK
ncbi:MAG: tryptophan 7-halogenase, partial [Cyanobacteriota bacterium]|nr:tryptophan 7-halogenase [Cyanobacteriota bacterium]